MNICKLLGKGYQEEADGVFFNKKTKTRVTVANDGRLYNVYVERDGQQIATSTGVQEKDLETELRTVAFLTGNK